MKYTSFVASGTSIVALVSALFLVTACDSSPAANGFAASSADKDAEARLRPVGTMPHLQPFDESFYVAPADEAAAD